MTSSIERVHPFQVRLPAATTGLAQESPIFIRRQLAVPGRKLKEPHAAVAQTNAAPSACATNAP